MTDSFDGLRDLNDGLFCWVTRFQQCSVLVGYKVSVMVGFGGSRDLNDSRFCWVMRFQ